MDLIAAVAVINGQFHVTMVQLGVVLETIANGKCGKGLGKGFVQIQSAHCIVDGRIVVAFSDTEGAQAAQVLGIFRIQFKGELIGISGFVQTAETLVAITDFIGQCICRMQDNGFVLLTAIKVISSGLRPQALAVSITSCLIWL